MAFQDRHNRTPIQRARQEKRSQESPEERWERIETEYEARDRELLEGREDPKRPPSARVRHEWALVQLAKDSDNLLWLAIVILVLLVTYSL